jgi:putative DNA primase/helicase
VNSRPVALERPDLASLADLWGRGWSVIPVQYRDKRPAIATWREYQKRPATFSELQEWFDRPARLNVGVVTGRVSGLFVIDCDSPDAVAWAEATLPPCDVRVRTSKGIHLYYPYSGDRPARNRVRVQVGGREMAIDVRADGGFVVGPGSVHASGAVYTREGGGW